MNVGFIYFLTNRAYSGLVKIGFTTNPVEMRMSQLNSTGVPFPFELAACFFVSQPHACEQHIHEVLSAHRTSKDREFFSGHMKELLDLAFPVVSRYIGERSGGNSALSDKELGALKLLSGYTRGAGFSTEHVARHVFVAKELFDKLPHRRDSALTEAYAVLESLKGLLYVSNPFDENHWRITENGLGWLKTLGADAGA